MKHRRKDVSVDLKEKGAIWTEHAAAARPIRWSSEWCPGNLFVVQLKNERQLALRICLQHQINMFEAHDRGGKGISTGERPTAEEGQ